jgi:serine/threonine protein kinase
MKSVNPLVSIYVICFVIYFVDSKLGSPCMLRCCTGVGTYGEVRYGRCVATDNHVAVKIVDLSRFRNEAAVIMKRETQILRHANHEHVIAILDVKENIKYRGIASHITSSSS